MAIGAAEIAVGALGATGGGVLPVAIAATTFAVAVMTQGASFVSKAAKNLRTTSVTTIIPKIYK